MSLPESILRILERYQVRYQVFNIYTKQDLVEQTLFQNTIEARCFFIDFQPHLVIYKSSNRLLEEKLGLHVQKMSQQQSNHWFFDCEPGFYPPLGRVYGLDTLIDPDLKELDFVFFNAGAQHVFLQIHFDDLLLLNHPVKWKQMTEIKQVTRIQEDKIEKSRHLLSWYNPPALTPSVQQALHYAKQKESDLSGIWNIFEGQPAIKSLIELLLPDVYTGPLTDIAAHLAVLLDMSRYVELGSGPLGWDAFWHHALSAAHVNAALSQASKLAISYPAAYITGLLHNIGWLFVAKWFKSEFALLSKWLLLNRHTPIVKLEKRLLLTGEASQLLRGGHTLIGALLLHEWHLDEMLGVVAREHHNLFYSGEFRHYVTLIQLSNKLLYDRGIGEADIPSVELLHLSERLAIPATKANQIVTEHIFSRQKMQSFKALWHNELHFVYSE